MKYKHLRELMQELESKSYLSASEKGILEDLKELFSASDPILKKSLAPSANRCPTCGK